MNLKNNTIWQTSQREHNLCGRSFRVEMYILGEFAKPVNTQGDEKVG